MFYKLIEKKRDEWFESPDCTVRGIIEYIEAGGKMRDAQVEAIKTWLYLKIACGNEPLWRMFSEGKFNSLDLDDSPLSSASRAVLKSDKAAAALLEYSRLTDRNGRQLAPELDKFISMYADRIDYEAAFRTIFNGIDYPDYLFSLPMGAGKTYLMAAFIYLDLYFAQNEPDNPCFAHNFMILAPSGLKSSIVPSLRHIKEFDPSWVIPEPAAGDLKRLVKFEVLDEQKTARRSNLVKNPNAQKINVHQPLEDLIGLVAVTNAEKVILDRADENLDNPLFGREELARIRQANELRDLIGRIPHLAVYIDEVHHASDSEIKLRKVVTGWSGNDSFNGVLGFSGTPYLEKAESSLIETSFTIKNTELPNVVYHYPLIEGVGNFLKIPEVKYLDGGMEEIVRNGVREFMDLYKDTVYADGTCAKLAIYCGQIETLEERIFPQVCGLMADYGLNPAESVLKYHGGNQTWPQPEGAEIEFASLDTEISKKRIILLVQIGKEGWDCKSLTGVILPHKGVCPTNMVLQTSCRCLRQVTKGDNETALIWLNKYNADILNKQLKQQQNISIRELNDGGRKTEKKIERFSRMDRVKVPPIDFYQLKVSFQTLVEKESDTGRCLSSPDMICEKDGSLIFSQNLSGQLLGIESEQRQAERCNFTGWLRMISKESFHSLSLTDLRRYEEELRAIFSNITMEIDNGESYLSPKYDHKEIRSRIRSAFVPKRDFSVKEETVLCQSQLLQIERLTSPVLVEDDSMFWPEQKEVHRIIEMDGSTPISELSAEDRAAVERLRKLGMTISINDNPAHDKTYHYLPYWFDSGFEVKYFRDVLALNLFKDKGLELYFNGDDNLTEFKIDCYRKNGAGWSYIGKYVPDFLLLDRKPDGSINRIAIIETKGKGFAANFKDRRNFMETEFISKNNEKFGYRRFSFLYLEDSCGEAVFLQKTIDLIEDFFKD